MTVINMIMAKQCLVTGYLDSWYSILTHWHVTINNNCRGGFQTFESHSSICNMSLSINTIKHFESCRDICRWLYLQHGNDSPRQCIAMSSIFLFLQLGHRQNMQGKQFHKVYTSSKQQHQKFCFPKPCSLILSCEPFPPPSFHRKGESGSTPRAQWPWNTPKPERGPLRAFPFTVDDFQRAQINTQLAPAPQPATVAATNCIVNEGKCV